MPSRDLPLAAGAVEDGRTLLVRLMAWDTPARVTDDGRTWYREAFARSGLTVPAGRRIVGLLELEPGSHRGDPVARLEAVEDRPDGLYGRVRVARTRSGDDLLALIDEQIVDGVSVEFDAPGPPARAGELVTRSAATLAAFVFTRTPLHTASRVLAVRSTEDTVPETLDDLDTPTEPVPPPDDEPEPDEPDVPADTVRRSAPVPGRPDPSRHPAARAPAPAPVRRAFRSFGDAIHDAGHDQAAAADVFRHLRAWADELASDIPGLLPHTYTGRVVSIMGGAMPTVSAFSSMPLPSEGEYIHVGVVTQPPGFGGPVAAEKTELPSGKMLVSDLPIRINVYGGGFDVGWFAWKRSSPNVIDQALVEWAKVAAQQIEADASAMVIAGATGNADAPVTIDPADPNASFVEAAKALASSVKRFPEVAVIGLDLWAMLATATDLQQRPLFPHLSPTNPVGRASIVDDTGEVRGLTFYVSTEMAPASGVLGVREAFVSAVGPRTTLGVDVPRLAGRDVAVLMEAAMAVTDGRGLVELVAGTPVGTTSSGSRRRGSSSE